VKLELELELELAGLGCSDFKEEEKAIINKFMGHYTSKIKEQHHCSKILCSAKTVRCCARKMNTHCIMPKTVTQENHGILFVLSTMFLLDAETSI